MRKSVGKIIGKVKSVVLTKGLSIQDDEPVEPVVVEPVVKVEKKTTKAKKPAKKSKVKKSDKDADTKERV
tara:strand:+ start:4450 stop:4659 length:210 start_codon:yes stop_codon:yes gene_type:complete